VQAYAPTMHLIAYNISNALLPEVYDLENQPSTPTHEPRPLQGRLCYLPWLWPSATASMTRPGTLQLQRAGTQTTSPAGGSLKHGGKLKGKLCQEHKHGATFSNLRSCSFMGAFYYLILLEPPLPSLLLRSYRSGFLPSIPASHPSGWRISHISSPVQLPINSLEKLP